MVLFYTCMIAAMVPIGLFGSDSNGIPMTKEPHFIAADSAAPARHGHFAELEELEAARKVGTLAAYDLFLERHPDSRYAKEARKERAALAAK